MERDTLATLPRLISLLRFIGLVLATSPLGAQEYVFAPRVQWDVRADGLFRAPATAQVGGGLNVPAGYYVRVGADVAAGASVTSGGAVTSARTDLVARYLLDPFRELRWAPYAGAGVTGVWTDAAHWRGYLLAVAGIEGPVHDGWRTAIEIGLGHGLRAGVVLRRARVNGR